MTTELVAVAECLGLAVSQIERMPPDIQAMLVRRYHAYKDYGDEILRRVLVCEIYGLQTYPQEYKIRYEKELL